jgi:nicotinate-nucleotide pyrophosphorylase (carboxylating)
MQPVTATRPLETLSLPIGEVRRIVANALAEDLGSGDITTDNLVPIETRARAEVSYRSGGVVCGLQVLAETFHAVDESLTIEELVSEGGQVAPRTVVAVVRGSARSILKGERVALNFIQRMSGIATATAQYVREVEGFPTHVIDTRKTSPGLRLLERHAVRVGGGRNHRYNLSDGVLVKDNHLVALRTQGVGTVEALRRLRDRIPHTARIEVEVDSIEQIPDMIEGGVDAILFDNFTPEQAKEGVKVVAGRALIEISGGVSLSTIRAYAEAGVNVISVGALTHSTPALDVGLDFSLEEGRA